MLRRVCCVCGNGMTHRPLQGEVGYHCEQCDDFTPYDELEMEAYCPDCVVSLTVCVACGSQSFFCKTCAAPKSSKKVVWKPV